MEMANENISAARPYRPDITSGAISEKMDHVGGDGEAIHENSQSARIQVTVPTTVASRVVCKFTVLAPKSHSFTVQSFVSNTLLGFKSPTLRGTREKFVMK